MAVTLSIVDATPRTPRIDECCSLLTLSKIPRTIGVSIRLKQSKFEQPSRNPALEEIGFLVS